MVSATVENDLLEISRQWKLSKRIYRCSSARHDSTSPTSTGNKHRSRSSGPAGYGKLKKPVDLRLKIKRGKKKRYQTTRAAALQASRVIRSAPK